MSTSHPQRSAHKLAERLGIIGSVKGGPADLSTNRKHFDGFGKIVTRLKSGKKLRLIP